MVDEVKLFKTWSSRFGLRIVWALKLKGVEYESIDEDLSNKSFALLHYNPIYKKVPVLLHNAKPISESLVILQYIDETWNHYPLMPRDPLDKAKALFWAKFGDDKVLPAISRAFKSEGKEQEEALSEWAENISYLEEELKGKTFFGGETIGYVDLALGWLANLVSVFEEITGLKVIEEAKFPLLSAWIREFSNAPVIKDTWPSHERLLTKYRALREGFIQTAAASK